MLRAAFAATVIVVLSGCREAARDERHDESTRPAIEGVYSDVAYHDESGDVLGTEVIIWRSASRYMVSFRHSEGVPGRRSVVPLAVNGDSIEFTIPPDTGVLVHGGTQRPVETDPARKVTGRISVWGLRGVVEEWIDSLALPRKERSYFRDSIPAG